MDLTQRKSFLFALKLAKGSEETGSGRLHPPKKGMKELWEMGRYLEVWCKVIGLKWGTEASCTIRQISYCLMGEGALGDVGVIAILLQAGRSYICKLLQSHAYK